MAPRRTWAIPDKDKWRPIELPRKRNKSRQDAIQSTRRTPAARQQAVMVPIRKVLSVDEYYLVSFHYSSDAKLSSRVRMVPMLSEGNVLPFWNTRLSMLSGSVRNLVILVVVQVP